MASMIVLVFNMAVVKVVRTKIAEWGTKTNG
jgi:hypothetical protein